MNKTQFLAARLARSAVARGATVASLLATLGMSAHAALPAGVITAIDSAGADMMTNVTDIIKDLMDFWGLKKLASKFGWI